MGAGPDPSSGSSPGDSVRVPPVREAEPARRAPPRVPPG